MTELRLTRRGALAGAAGIAGGALADAGLPGAIGVPDAPTAPSLATWFADLEQRTFRFFWDLTDPATGLTPDRSSAPMCSIAAVGMALTAYGIGAERGWIARIEAAARTLMTLRFLLGLPQGDAANGTAGYRGFFYHFLDSRTGLRHSHTELSTVDSTMLFLGALYAAAFFDRADGSEAAIRKLAIELVERAEWDWWQQSGPGISMGWHPETGMIPRIWDGYNEGKMVYLLALGAERHPARPDSWATWTAPYTRFWRGEGPTRRLAFGPLFPGQYTELWYDLRGVRDGPMREAGLDYYENARRETYANRAWCIANPMGWDGYGKDVWGLAACDGPGDHTVDRGGREAKFRGYSARGPANEPDGFDDGTITPSAVLGTLPFAPEICIPAATALYERHGARIYGRYGFRDAFNPSFRETGVAAEHGTVDPVHGWVASDWVGIDEGPILMGLANYRDEGVWRVMRRSPHIRRGLMRAGFTGGWLRRA